jgi:hypothetical protein
MKAPRRWAALVAASAVLLAGCASSAGADQPARMAGPAGAAMTPGMVMPDGSTMGAMAPSASSQQSGPSAAALMICSDETRADIAQVLALPDRPTATATWRAHTYTCSYRLPAGPFVLSVTESADGAAAARYLADARRRLGTTTDLAGLTEGAFGTAAGNVLLRKDNDVLHVDATALPAVFGTQGQKRADFAYEIASDILGCWTGD